MRGLILFDWPVIAGLAARRAIVKAVLAKANINLPLARAAILFAVEICFRRLALHTDHFLAGSC